MWLPYRKAALQISYFLKDIYGKGKLPSHDVDGEEGITGQEEAQGLWVPNRVPLCIPAVIHIGGQIAKPLSFIQHD